MGRRLPGPDDAAVICGEPLRFLTVGTLNVAISFGVFRASHAVLVTFANSGDARRLAAIAALATAIGYIVGTLNSFLLNRAWTFNAAPARGQLKRFVTLNAAVLLASSAAMGSLIGVGDLPAIPSWIAVTAAMTVVNYLGSKLWAFAPAGPATALASRFSPPRSS